MYNTHVNITIMARDRLWHTMRTLNTLWDTIGAVGKPSIPTWDLTILDDGSEDETRDAIEDWVKNHNTRGNVYLVRNMVSEGITGKCRNQVINCAEGRFGRGDFLYLSDNDVHFTDGWLQDLCLAYSLASFKELGLKVLGGWNHPFLHPNQTILVETLTSYGEDYYINLCDAIAGPSWLLEWETWDKYGPFDAHAVGVRQSEDWAVCQKIIQDGGVVGCLSPHVIYNTGATDTFGEQTPGSELMGRGHEIR